MFVIIQKHFISNFYDVRPSVRQGKHCKLQRGLITNSDALMFVTIQNHFQSRYHNVRLSVRPQKCCNSFLFHWLRKNLSQRHIFGIKYCSLYEQYKNKSAKFYGFGGNLNKKSKICHWFRNIDEICMNFSFWNI